MVETELWNLRYELNRPGAIATVVQHSTALLGGIVLTVNFAVEEREKKRVWW